MRVAPRRRGFKKPKIFGRERCVRIDSEAQKKVAVLTLVALVLCDLLGDVLDLEQQFDTLDRRYGGLGDRGGHTAGEKVLGKSHWIRES